MSPDVPNDSGEPVGCVGSGFLVTQRFQHAQQGPGEFCTGISQDELRSGAQFQLGQGTMQVTHIRKGCATDDLLEFLPDRLCAAGSPSY